MTDNTTPHNPRVFISYSWDSPEHKLWVESFARELRKDGIDARIDAWRDESQSIDDFMMLELERADFVIAICTPQYKQKIIENAEGDVKTASGFEMGTAAALRRAGGKDVIPVLRAGEWTEAAPSSLISYRFYDFTGGDVSAEFEALRDRLLGHVRRPPELGQPKAPASGPELPDIFEGEGHPAPASETRPSPPDTPRSAPPQADPHPVAPPTPIKRGSKGWLWALGGAVGVIVLLLLIPTGEEGADPALPMSLQDEAGVGDFQAGDAQAGDASFEDAGGEAPEASETAELPAAEDAGPDIVQGWASVADESGCLYVTQLGEQTWLVMGYDAGTDVYLLQAYDPAWDEEMVGKTDLIVTELDNDESTAYMWQGLGIEDGGVPGIQLEFDDMSFLRSLGQHNLLSFYWNDDESSHREFWVMDANLRGAGRAGANLSQCGRRS